MIYCTRYLEQKLEALIAASRSAGLSDKSNAADEMLADMAGETLTVGDLKLLLETLKPGDGAL